MKIQVESLTAVKKKLVISVSEDEFKTELDDAYTKAGKEARIPGFRPGKAPRTLLEKRYGQSIESEVYQNIVRSTMVKALEENELDAVAVPQISDTKREQGEGFSFVASVEVKPKLEPKDYKGIKVTQKKDVIGEEQIKAVFTRLQEAQSVLKNNDRATKPEKKDFVSLLIQGCEADGTLTTPEADHKEQLYEVGGGIMHEAIDKEVVHMSLNDSKTIKISVKNTEDEKAPDREFHVKVTLKAIKEKILPELTDEFAKSVGPFENLAALRTQIEKDLVEELAEKSKAETAQKLLEEIVKKNPAELPESLVHRELHSMMNGFWSQLEQAGIKEIPAEYTEEKLHEQMEPDAKRRVHEQLLIEAIAKTEKIEVEETDLNKRLAEIARASKVPTAELRAYYEKTGRIEGLHFQMLAHKTLDFLLSTATIKS